MKIAGRKNDGAWFRTNAAIQGNQNQGILPLSSQEKESLIEFLRSNLLYASQYVNNMAGLAVEAGVPVPEALQDAPTFVASLINYGIPRQVWMGKLTFTTYTKVGAGAAAKWVPNYADAAANFGNELRGFIKRWMFARRQIYDVAQVGPASGGNPGGVADANPAT